MARVRLEHIFCDCCNEEMKDNIHSLRSEGAEWDACSPECYFILEKEKYEQEESDE